MGLFCFWLKCLTLSSRWRRKAEEEKRKKEAEEQHKAAQMPSYEEQMVWAAIVVRTSPTLTTLAPPPSFSACPRRRMATHRPTSSVFEGLLRRAAHAPSSKPYSRAALNLATPRSRP